MSVANEMSGLKGSVDVTFHDVLDHRLALELSRNPGLLEEKIGGRPRGTWICLDEIQEIPARFHEASRQSLSYDVGRGDVFMKRRKAIRAAGKPTDRGVEPHRTKPLISIPCASIPATGIAGRGL